MKTNRYCLHKQSAFLLCGMLIGGTVTADSKTLMLQILGSGGPELSDKRASTSYLLSLDGKARLFQRPRP